MARPNTTSARLLAGSREPVRVASTANLTLSGLQTIDGVTVEAGNRVLAKNQTDATENGIYEVSSGTWYRAGDARTSRAITKGVMVHVQSGTVHAGDVYVFGTRNPDIGEDDITLELYLSTGLIEDIQEAVSDLIDQAQDAADAAINATGIGLFATKTAAAAATLPAATKHVRLGGCLTVGVGAWPLAVRVSSGSSSDLSKFRSQDRYMPDGSTDNTNGGWWQLRASRVEPEMFEAAGDGVESTPGSGTWTGTDDKLALQAWAAFDAPVKELKDKVYLTSGSIDLLPNKTYRGVFGASRIVGISGGSFSTGNAGNAYVVGCKGASSLTAISQTVSGSIVPTTQQLDFSASLASYGMKRGDIIVLYDRRDYSWSGFRDYYRAGEFLEFNVLASGTNGSNARLKVKSRIRDTYTGSDVDFYLMPSATVDIQNIMFDGISSTEALELSLLTRVRVRGVKVGGSTVQAAQFDRCYDIDAEIGGSMEAAEAGNQYVCVIANCTRFVVRSTSDSTRHPVAIGGNDIAGGIPNRDGIIDGARLMSTGTGSAGLDAHGNSDNVVWRDCDVENGAAFGGRNMRIKGGRILGADFGTGICLYGSEVHSGLWSIEDLVIENHSNPGTFGIIDFQGAFGGTTVDGGTYQKSRGDATVRLRGIRMTVTSAAPTIVWAQNNSDTYKLNIDIDDFQVVGGASVTELLRYVGVTGVAKASFIHIGNNIKGLKSGAYACIFSGTTPADSSTDVLMPVQGGTVDLATANATSATVASIITYRWAYPAEPVGQVSIDVATQSPFPGKGIEGKFYSKDGTTVRPAIYSHDGANWTSAVTVTANWQVGPKVTGFG